MNELKKRVTNLSEIVNVTARELELFFSHVDQVSSPNGCWLWTGCTQYGYGLFCFRMKSTKAHRFAWILRNGRVPEDNPFVLHDCPGGDNRSCVNPDHLWVGTTADNQADMVKKGRSAKGDRSPTHLHPESYKGENNGQSKLSNAQVVAIRARRACGELQYMLAKEFGIGNSTMSRLIRRESYPHI